MIPMIVSLKEVRWVREMAAKVRRELKSERIPFDERMQIGIMIETPAAALIADELAEEADFFSVGSNDLIQYTLAADRQNPELEEIADPHHKAVLRLIRRAAECAHAAGKWVGVCGELARDPELTEFFSPAELTNCPFRPRMCCPFGKNPRSFGKERGCGPIHPVIGKFKRRSGVCREGRLFRRPSRFRNFMVSDRIPAPS